MHLRLSRLLLAATLPMLAVVCPTLARSQGNDTTVSRVQRLVNAGDRVGARRLADSLLALATEGTPAFAEALFARAFASSSAVEAERDYLRVSVEYPLSARSEDATMMVGQLKLARSDRAGARRSFERLVREHPDGAQAAKAAFWAGRLALEDGDAAHGCPSLGRAKAAVSAEDVELANQIEYYAQRCSASALAGLAPPAPVESVTAPPPSATSPAATPAKGKAPPRTTSKPAPMPAAPERAPVTEAPRDTLPPATTAPDTPAPRVSTKEYSVQVAAFPKMRDAVALSEVLKQRGFPVRVWGTKPPFRVRVGRYATREEADAARGRMKAARVNGLVVEAEPQ